MTFRRYVLATHGPTLESRFPYRLARAADIDKGKEFVMAEAALFIGWAEQARGREKLASRDICGPHFDRAADISAELRPGRPDPACR